MLSACSSEEGGSQAMGGKGAVILDLAAETVFDTKTKAVDESTYLTDRPLADRKAMWYRAVSGNTRKGPQV